MWRRTYLLLLLVRVYFALSPSYIHPDEHFQGPEVFAGKRLPLFPCLICSGFPSLKFLLATDQASGRNPACARISVRTITIMHQGSLRRINVKANIVLQNRYSRILPDRRGSSTLPTLFAVSFHYGPSTASRWSSSNGSGLKPRREALRQS
jgi:hypothetical protein